MKTKILLIEDNVANLELILYLLDAFGYATCHSLTGEAGIASAQSENPDLILCDIQLPDINGSIVVQRIKAIPELQNVPVIAVTAYAMVGDQDRLVASGFDGYISKPIVPETFVRDVERLLSPEKRSGSTPDVHKSSGSFVRKSARRHTILVVDDSPINRELIRSTLEPSGYQLILARDAMEALAFLKETTPSLIVSDLHMPKITGKDFLKMVKNNPDLKDIPFLVITSSMQEDTERTICLELGAKGYIRRPIEPEALLKEVSSCIQENL